MRLRLTLPASMSDGHFVRSLLRAVPLEERSHSSMARRGTLGMLGVLAQGGVRFLTNILVGRLGGPAVLATVASAASTAQLLSLVGPTTTGSAAAKFLAQARGRAESGEIAAVAAHLAHRTVQTAVALAAVAAPLWVLVDGGGWAEGLCVSLLVLAYSGATASHAACNLEPARSSAPRRTTSSRERWPWRGSSRHSLPAFAASTCCCRWRLRTFSLPSPIGPGQRPAGRSYRCGARWIRSWGSG